MGLSKLILKISGWKIDKHSPEGVDKAVVCMGPHTSNWDFIIGMLAFNTYGVKPKYLIKSDLFFFPLGWILKKLGGIPVDRKKNNNLTDLAVKHFEENDTMYMVFTPEGTRSYNDRWKKGFYYIAQNAKVPIYIAYIDYEKKIGGFLERFDPTGDVDADIISIKKKLSPFAGKVKENGIKAEG